MEEREEGIVVLIDENGEEVEFEHLDTIEMNGNEYVVLIPLEEEETEESDTDEVIILKVEHSKEGEDSFVTVEDEYDFDEEDEE